LDSAVEHQLVHLVNAFNEFHFMSLNFWSDCRSGETDCRL